MANVMENIWALLRERDSRGVSKSVLRSARQSLIRRVLAAQKDNGTVEYTGTGVVLSIDGEDTTGIERMVRADSRSLVSAVDDRKV